MSKAFAISSNGCLSGGARMPHNKLLQLTLDRDLPSLPLRSAVVKRS